MNSVGYPARDLLPEQRPDPLEPAAESGPRLARIDEVVNGKGLGAREGAALRREGLFELHASGVGILGGFDLAAKGHGHAAFDGQGADLR